MRSTQDDSVRVALLNETAFALHNTSPITTLSKSREALDLIHRYQGDLEFERSVALKNLGLAYWRLAKYDSSLYFQEKAIEIAEQIGSDSLKAKIISNKALVYKERGQYSLSLDNSFRAYSAFRELGDELNEAIVSSNIGTVYKEMGNYTEAYDYYLRSIAIGNKITNGLIICGNYNFLGEVLLLMEGFDESREYLELAIAYCDVIDNKYYLSQGYFNLGTLLGKMGKLDSAFFYYNTAFELQKELGDQKGMSSTLNALGRLSIDKSEFENAYKFLMTAYEIAENNDLLFEMRDNFALKIRFDSLTQNYFSAFRNYGVFNALSDSINRMQQVNEVAEVISQYQNEALLMDKELQEEVIMRQALQSRFIISILIFTLLIIFILVYVIRNKTSMNKTLKLLNHEITEQKEELQLQSNQLRLAHDDTNQKNKELTEAMDQLRDAQRKLIESEKMVSLGVLSAGVAHEINNPMNFIKGGINGLTKEITKSDLAGDDVVAKYIQIINEGVDRSQSIIRSLSHFSRSGGEMDEECNVNSILDNCLVMLQNKLKGRVEINKEIEKDLPLIIGNEGRLHQAFLNILSNADQAIDGQGEITLATRSSKDNVRVVIKDSGSGIDKKYYSKIMDPFFTTKEPGVGTGLGLSITYRIIEEHGGKIEFDSQIGVGTEFTVSIPIQ